MSLYLPDVNVLIYAFCEQAPNHEGCRRWLDQVAEKGDILCLCEIVEVALLRIPTLPTLKMAPIQEVIGFWKEDLLGYPHLRKVSTGSRHSTLLSEFISTLKISGNDLNDAWLAALAIEQGATLVSTDKGFRKYPKLKWLNPID